MKELGCGGPLRGGDIWLIWRNETELGTADGTVCTKVQRLGEAEERGGGHCGWHRAVQMKMKERGVMARLRRTGGFHFHRLRSCF